MARTYFKVADTDGLLVEIDDNMWLGLRKSTMWAHKNHLLFQLCSVITYDLFVQIKQN